MVIRHPGSVAVLGNTQFLVQTFCFCRYRIRGFLGRNSVGLDLCGHYQAFRGSFVLVAMGPAYLVAKGKRVGNFLGRRGVFLLAVVDEVFLGFGDFFRFRVKPVSAERGWLLGLRYIA